MDDLAGALPSTIRDLRLDLSFRSDLDAKTLNAVFHRSTGCHTFKLNVSMCDLQDDVMESLRVLTDGVPPRWERVHLALKHNQITDRGAAWLLQSLSRCTGLISAHINLSYNRVKRLQHCQNHLRKYVIKNDGDVFELSPPGFCMHDLHTKS